MMYFASLAFSIQHHPMAASDLTAEIAFQAGATAAFALASAAFFALSIIGPVRRMATIMRTIARGAEYVPVDRMPLLQNNELGALAASTNQMLDRLEHSDRERLALQTTLEDKVAERTLRLCEANDQIAREFDARVRMELELRQVQRLEAIGRLAAGIAHEINTPVQFVSDSLQFVREGVDELVAQLDRGPAAADDADGVDLPYLREQLPLAIERALEGLGRVTTIIRSMRNHAHPDRTERTPVDLNEAITSTLTIARNEYKYVAELETALDPLPPVSCYVGDFNQVIINLIVNAAHAISDVVGTSGQKGRLVVKTWRDGPDVAISVADTGGGIPEWVRDHIFEPFFTTKPVGKGTGQGLAIAHSVIVEKHGGSLTFDTVAGEGTTFLIRIPIAGAGAQSDAA
jgi:signal transduction histidine kinase